MSKNSPKQVENETRRRFLQIAAIAPIVGGAAPRRHRRELRAAFLLDDRHVAESAAPRDEYRGSAGATGTSAASANPPRLASSSAAAGRNELNMAAPRGGAGPPS